MKIEIYSTYFVAPESHRQTRLNLNTTWFSQDIIVPGAANVICKFREMGKKVFFCTNNSTKSRANYVEKCKKLGFGGDKVKL